MNRLSAAGIESPGLEARLLIGLALGIKAESIVAGDVPEPDYEQRKRLESFITRRLSGEPFSRIAGRREFWGLEFRLSPDVLDPRPDTEMIVEMAIQALRDKPPRHILDLGTGSGCLLIALLSEFPEAEGTGIDISSGALDIARDNAVRNHVADRTRFICSDWPESLRDSGESFDLIVSNPPYIPESEIESLAPEVKNHDPILALTGGNDGLDAYKSIIREIKPYLSSDGLCLFEVGRNQADSVARLVGESGFSVNRIGVDLAGIPRVVEFRHGDK